MLWTDIQQVLFFIQHVISLAGILVILSGVLYALYQFLRFSFGFALATDVNINSIRLNLGRVLILGLEFIVAADLIGTTTTPDYYAVGMLAIIVIIRTVLSFSISRELSGLSTSANG